MKARIQFLISISLLISVLGVAFFMLSGRDRDPAQVFPATINRDCAPWDGAAFTMSVQYDPSTMITIAIWKSPSFAFPAAFSFPDQSMRVGTAYSLTELDPPEELTGTVTFWRVEAGIPVEGSFHFAAESGEQFEGKFRAEWGNQMAYCG
jgi:hypothetical protein